MGRAFNWFRELDIKLKVFAGIAGSIIALLTAGILGYGYLNRHIDKRILETVLPVIEQKVTEESKKRADEIMPILIQIGEDMKDIKVGMGKFDEWIELDIRRDIDKQVKKIKHTPHDIKISDIENLISDYEKLAIKDAKVKAQYEILFKWYKENL